MKVLIDLESCQAQNRNRGIGIYSYNLAYQLILQHPQDEIYLLLSDSFPDALQEVYKAFSSILPSDRILVWSAPKTCSYIEGLHFQREAGEAIKEGFIKEFNPDVYLVTSFFEGFFDNSITVVPDLKNGITAVVLYDLIPYLWPDVYLLDPVMSEWYKHKFNKLERFNLFLTDSNSAKKEVLTCLPVQRDQVETIFAATSDCFKKQMVDEDVKANLFEKFGIQSKFFMYTGGIDPRKNIEGLIIAYAQTGESIKKQYQLVIVCKIAATDKLKLENLVIESGLSKTNVVFTGFVTTQELVALYNLSDFFIFPSWHEGFGLPCLEAMSCGKAVIASNQSSIPEIIGREDCLFDPFSYKDIAAKIEQVATDSKWKTQLEEHSLNQSKKFSWIKSGQLAWNAIQAATKNKLVSIKEGRESVNQLKLALVTPVLPAKTGIAVYAQVLIQELAKYYSVDVIVNQKTVNKELLDMGDVVVRSVEDFKAHYFDYDRVVYEFGNSDYHAHMFELLSQYPGIVDLHDFYLSGIESWHPTQSGFIGFAEALFFSHGYKAVKDYVGGVTRGSIGLKYPTNLSVLQHARSVILHNRYAMTLLEKFYNVKDNAKFQIVPLFQLKQPSTYVSKQDARKILHIEYDEFVVVSLGNITPLKLTHQLIRAWQRSCLSGTTKCKLVFVGATPDPSYKLYLQNILRKESSNSLNNIEFLGFCDDLKYELYARAADCAVQLRTLSRGESSGAVIDAMTYGIPVIVNLCGSMRFLPTDSVLKLNEYFDVEELSGVLEKLYLNKSLREKMGECAAQFVQNERSPTVCCRNFVEIIEKSYANFSVFDLLKDKRLGLNGDLDCFELSQVMARNFKISPRQRQILFWLPKEMSYELDKLTIIQELIEHDNRDYRFEGICWCEKSQEFVYTRKRMCEIIGIDSQLLMDSFADLQPSDIVVAEHDLSIEIRKRLETRHVMIKSWVWLKNFIEDCNVR